MGGTSLTSTGALVASHAPLLYVEALKAGEVLASGDAAPSAAGTEALVKGGLSTSQALGMLVLVYSGTAQLAALPLMAAGAALGAVWVTALLANLRFVVYSAVVATEFRGLPLARPEHDPQPGAAVLAIAADERPHESRLPVVFLSEHRVDEQRLRLSR
jgi:hypothetical protein